MLATEITLRDILQMIAKMTDAELIQLKGAARKEMERRNLKLSRHSTQHSAPSVGTPNLADRNLKHRQRAGVASALPFFPRGFLDHGQPTTLPQAMDR